MATLKDLKEGYKEKLRNSFESNTGVLGQAMQDRREKEAKDQRTQRRVDKINQTTEAIRVTGSTLTHIEVLFTQISKNFQLVNKEFGVAVTLQEETNKTLAAVAAAKLEKKADVSATQLTFGAMPKGEELEDINFDTGGPSILESILDALDFGLDRAKRAAKKAAARRAARRAAQRAAKKAAKDAAKKAAQKAGAKAAKEAAKRGLEGKAKQQFIKQAEKAAAKAAEEKAAKQMAQIAEKQAARAAKKEALEAAEKAAAKAAEKKAAEVAEKKAAEAAAKKAAEVAAKAAAEAAAKKATKEVIKKSAIKAVAKNLAKAGVKSIPLVGAAVGVGFAVVKIFQGDYVGAGVEAASGVGSAVTAVPAAVYSTIREVYFEVYGVWPESDPKVNERMPELKQIVTDEASNFLGKKVEPAPPPPTAVKAPPPAVVLPPPTTAPPAHVCTCPPVAAAPAVGTTPVVQTPVAPPPQEKGRSGNQGMAPQPTAPAPAPTTKPASTPAPAPAAPPPQSVAGAAVSATGPAPKPKTGTSVDGESLLLETLKKYNYPPPAIAMIMAQAAHESGHFKHLEENMSFSAKGLMKTWPSRFPTMEIAEQYANKPEKIANRAYGGRPKDLGNGPEESGDGWKYRGRGYIGITGRSLYEKAGKALGIDLINNPDMAAEPKIAAELVVYFFKSQAKRITDWLDIENVTKVVNGGFIGLEDRKKQFKTYLAQLEAGTLLSGGSKASSGAAVAEQSTQVAAVKADNKQQQPNVNIIKVNETNRKTVTV